QADPHNHSCIAPGKPAPRSFGDKVHSGNNRWSSKVHPARPCELPNLVRRGSFGDQRSIAKVDEDEHWMWVTRMLRRLDEYMRRSTCQRCKALKSTKLLFRQPSTIAKLAKSLLLVAGCYENT